MCLPDVCASFCICATPLLNMYIFILRMIFHNDFGSLSLSLYIFACADAHSIHIHLYTYPYIINQHEFLALGPGPTRRAQVSLRKELKGLRSKREDSRDGLPIFAMLRDHLVFWNYMITAGTMTEIWNNRFLVWKERFRKGSEGSEAGRWGKSFTTSLLPWAYWSLLALVGTILLHCFFCGILLL